MTSDDGNRQTLQQVIGRNLRAIRGDRTQDEFSRELRAAGIDWSRATLAAVETGARDVSIEEFLTLLVTRRVAAQDLLAATDLNAYVELTATSAALPAALSLLFRKNPPLVGGGSVTSTTASIVDQWRDEWRDNWEQLRKVCPDVIIGDPHKNSSYSMPGAFGTDSMQDTEQKAAIRLGVSPIVVAAAARTLWGESLTEHRDALIGTDDAVDSPRARQAQKGHVTRGLLKEIERFLTDRDVLPAAASAKPKKSTRPRRTRDN